MGLEEKLVMEEFQEERPRGRKVELSERAQFLRGVIYCANVFYVMTGVSLIAIGFWVQKDPIQEDLILLLGNDLYLLAGKVTVAGGIVCLVVSFLGCIGARLESRPVLMVYFFLLLGVFVVEFTGGCLGVAWLVSAETEQNLTWSLRQNYNATGGEDYTKAVDFFQKKFRCCGIVGNVTAALIEFRMTAFWLNQSPLLPRKVLPLSCCRKGMEAQICQMERPINQYRFYAYDVGCLNAVEARVNEYGDVIGGVAISMSALQLVGMALTYLLWRAIPSKRVQVE